MYCPEGNASHRRCHARARGGGRSVSVRCVCRVIGMTCASCVCAHLLPRAGVRASAAARRLDRSSGEYGSMCTGWCRARVTDRIVVSAGRSPLGVARSTDLVVASVGQAGDSGVDEIAYWLRPALSLSFCLDRRGVLVQRSECVHLVPSSLESFLCLVDLYAVGAATTWCSRILRKDAMSTHLVRMSACIERAGTHCMWIVPSRTACLRW